MGLAPSILWRALLKWRMCGISMNQIYVPKGQRQAAQVEENGSDSKDRRGRKANDDDGRD